MLATNRKRMQRPIGVLPYLCTRVLCLCSRAWDTQPVLTHVPVPPCQGHAAAASSSFTYGISRSNCTCFDPRYHGTSVPEHVLNSPFCHRPTLAVVVRV